MKTLLFDKEKYPVRKIISKIFNTNNLEKSHLIYDNDKDMKPFNKYNDDKTVFHNIFYKSLLLNQLLEIYKKIIRELIMPLYKEENYIVYQKIPAFRVCIPNNRSVGEVHRDFDYNHPKEEMNYWLPITELEKENTCWYEKEKDKGNFVPILIDYGNIAEIYLNQLRHYCPINTTDKTRMSLDFRIIPGSKWEKIDKNNLGNSYFNKAKFSLGNYYDIIKKV